MQEKSKTCAVILAVLFSFWTWVYTYRDNAWKFWMCLILNVFLFWTIVLPFGVWVWAIVDAASQPMEYYKKYFKK